MDLTLTFCVSLNCKYIYFSNLIINICFAIYKIYNNHIIITFLNNINFLLVESLNFYNIYNFYDLSHFYKKINNYLLINKLGGNEICGVDAPSRDETRRMRSHAKIEVSDVTDSSYLLGVGRNPFRPTTKEAITLDKIFNSTLKTPYYLPPVDTVKHVYPVQCSTLVTPIPSTANSDSKSDSVLKCLYTNATSLNTSKLNELTAICDKDSPHVIFITETWWKPTSTVNLTNYNVYRKDRLTRQGGGVAIYLRNDLNSCEIELISTTSSEQLWVQLITGNEKILLGCIYRPPYQKSDSDAHIINAFNKVNQQLRNKKYDGVLIAGDFNLPTIKWIEGSALVEPGLNYDLATEFTDSLVENNLHQMIDFATFTKASGASENTLDYIITDQPIRIQHIGKSHPLGDSQQFHIVINCELRIKNPIPTNKFSSKVFNYKKGDYDAFNSFIVMQDWNALLDNNKSLNQNFESFSDVYNSACKQFIPTICLRINKKHRSPWMTPEVLKLLQHKKRLFYKNKSIHWKSAELVQQYKKAKNNLTKSHQSKNLGI